jgi:hypothetical protein
LPIVDLLLQVLLSNFAVGDCLPACYVEIVPPPPAAVLSNDAAVVTRKRYPSRAA